MTGGQLVHPACPLLRSKMLQGVKEMKAGLGATGPGFQSWLCPQCPEGSWVSAFPSLGLQFPDFRREVGARGQCPCLWLSAGL